MGTLEVTLAISGPPGDPVNIQVQSSNQNTWSVSDSVVTFTDSVLQRVVTITSLKVGLSSLILASFQPSRIVSPEPVDFESIGALLFRALLVLKLCEDGNLFFH